jgi:hypothetical protein
MTMKPGQETTVSVQFSMHEGMGGPHKFTINLASNDPVEPSTALTVAAAYPKP